MINKSIILLTTILFFGSCSVDRKITKLFKEGYTQEQPFKTKIPFEYRLGLIIIKVELNSETYDFVFDSGSCCTVMSKELTETLGKKKLLTKNVGGHQQDLSQSMDFTKIEALTIGGIKFKEIASGIGDFNQSIEVGCTEIDGIIGTNIMGLAIWAIDFRNQIITITNTKESLVLEGKMTKIPFYTNEIQMPYSKVKINGVEEEHVLIDLGSPGGFSLSYNNYEKIQKELPKDKKVTEYGYHASGFFGFGKKDSTYLLQADNLSIGAIELTKQIVTFSKSLNPTIGTAFFKNYDLVMNWKDEELLLHPHTKYDNQKFIRGGFGLNYQDDALKVSTLIKGSDAEQSGMQLGDKIIQLDGKDYSNITIADYCELIKQFIINNSVKTVVINRNGERLSFEIKNDVRIE